MISALSTAMVLIRKISGSRFESRDLIGCHKPTPFFCKSSANGSILPKESQVRKTFQNSHLKLGCTSNLTCTLADLTFKLSTSLMPMVYLKMTVFKSSCCFKVTLLFAVIYSLNIDFENTGRQIDSGFLLWSKP